MSLRFVRLVSAAWAVSSVVLSVGCAGSTPEPRQAPTEIHASGAPSASAGAVVAVLTKADWCSVCKAHGARAFAVLDAASKAGEIKLVVNDVTSEASASRSATELSEGGLSAAVEGAAPGTIAFLHPTTHKRLSEATVAHQDAEISTLMGLARKRAMDAR